MACVFISFELTQMTFLDILEDSSLFKSYFLIRNSTILLNKL